MKHIVRAKHGPQNWNDIWVRIMFKHKIVFFFKCYVLYKSNYFSSLIQILIGVERGNFPDRKFY